MIRLSLAFILVVCAITSGGIIFAQGDFKNQAGTVRGQIVDTTEGQNPIEGVTVVIVAADGTEFTTTTDANGDFEKSGIPAGRYLISIYRKGYGDRVGKPVTVLNGGDHYVPLKMTKKDNIVDFFQSSVPMYWVLILCVIIVILIFSRTNK